MLAECTRRSPPHVSLCLALRLLLRLPIEPLRHRQPGLSISARFRLLLEAYQLEQDYGLNIEAWRGPLQLQDEQLSVEYLRIGRIALYYQSLDGKNSGYWDTASQTWHTLAAQYNQPIAAAMRVAKNQSAPQLLSLPMAMPGASS